MTRKRTTQADRMDQASDILAHVYAHGACECWLEGLHSLKGGLSRQWSRCVEDHFPDNAVFASKMHNGCECDTPMVRIGPVRLRVVHSAPPPVEEKPVYGWKQEAPLVREYHHDLGCVLDELRGRKRHNKRLVAQLSRAYEQWSAWSRTQIWARALAWYWGVDGDLYAHAVNEHRKQYEREAACGEKRAAQVTS